MLITASNLKTLAAGVLREIKRGTVRVRKDYN